MEVFYQLLESYDQIKKRKFRIIKEQASPEAESKASAAMAQAQNGSWSEPVRTDGKNKDGVPVDVYMSGKGLPMYMINKGTNKPIEQYWNQFVSFFEDGAGGAAPTGEGGDVVDPNMVIEGPGSAFATGLHANHGLEELALKMDKKGKEIWRTLEEMIDPEEMQARFGSLAQFQNFFTGRSPQSLERKLSSAKGMIVDNGLLKDAVVDTSLIRATTESIVEFMDLLGNKDKSELDASTLSQFVFIDPEKKYISFRSMSEPDKGLMVADGTGFLRDLFTSLSPDSDFASYPINPGKGDDPAFRGTNMEHILEGISMLFACKKYQIADLCKEGRAQLENFKHEQAKMMEVHGNWSSQFLSGEIALRAEDKNVLDEITQIYGEGFTDIAKALVTASHDSMAIRQPDFIVQVGTEVGIGKKADTMEIWKADEDGECSNSKAGMARQGLQNFKPTRMVADLAFATNPNMLKAAKSSGMISGGGDEVCVAQVSIKNYLSFSKKNPKLGENSASRSGDYFMGMDTDIWSSKDSTDSMRLRQFGNKIVDRLGVSDTKKWWGDVNKYQQEIRGIADQVESLDTNLIAIDQAGDEGVKANSLQSTIDSVVKKLKENNTLDSQFNLNGDVGKALAALRDVDLNDITAPDHASKVIAAKRALGNFLINSKRAKDLDRERKTGRKGGATKHMISEMWTLGGADNDSLLFDSRGLLDGETHSSYQNDYLYEALEGAWSGKWDVTTAGSTLSVSDPKRPGVKINLSGQNRSGKGLLEKTIKEVNISPAFLRSTGGKPQKGIKLEMAEFVENQKRLLEDLLSKLG